MYTEAFSIVQETYILVSQKTVLRNTDVIQMRWMLDQQKDLVIDSDMKSEHETHSAGEYFFASTVEWIEDNISWKLEDFTGVLSVNIKCNNLQNVSEITELIFGWPKEKSLAIGISFCKNFLVNNELSDIWRVSRANGRVSHVWMC